ncbi:MAG: hypothetical protein U9M89_00580 [Patescibacteria group bacterium]|nr:hypothetical protein [Patescibacteria group bacterium]
MQRSLKMLVVLGLVLSSLTVSEEVLNTDFIETVKADNPYNGNTTNITDMTVEELATLIVTIIGSSDIATDVDALDSLLNNLTEEVNNMNDSIQSSLDELNQSINNSLWSVYDLMNGSIRGAVDSINENTSLYLFNETDTNLTFSEYIYGLFNVSEMNLSVSVDNISFEGLNESNILAYLINIEEGLGYSDRNTTLYDDMTNLYEFSYNSLCDLNGNYILRNSDGVSSFYEMAELVLASIENQGIIHNEVINQSNATRSIMHTEANSVKDTIGTEASWIASNSNSLWAMVAAISSVFLVLWVLFLKTRFGYLVDPSGNEENERFPGRATGLARLDPRKNQEQETPRCYLDVEQYNPLDPNCVSCKLRADCIENQIKYKDRLEREEREKAQREEEEYKQAQYKEDMQDLISKQKRGASMEGWD